MKKLQVFKFEQSPVRVTPDGKFCALDAVKALGSKNPKATWTHLKKQYPELVQESCTYSFGVGRPSEVITKDSLYSLAMVASGPKAEQFRNWVKTLLQRIDSGDVTLAAEIADRATEEDRRWLGVRLQSKSANKELNSSIKEHGGSEKVYGMVANKNNVAITGKTARELKLERKVRQTRDGMNIQELARMAYLEVTESASIENRNVKGDQAILNTVDVVTRQEAQLWRCLTGGSK